MGEIKKVVIDGIGAFAPFARRQPRIHYHAVIRSTDLDRFASMDNAINRLFAIQFLSLDPPKKAGQYEPCCTETMLVRVSASATPALGISASIMPRVTTMATVKAMALEKRTKRAPTFVDMVFFLSSVAPSQRAVQGGRLLRDPLSTTPKGRQFGNQAAMRENPFRPYGFASRSFGRFASIASE